MAPTLKLHLLGTPQIYLDDRPIQEFVTRKALALFIYIATNRQVHFRDRLAALFWRDVAEKRARNSLRRVLPNLRHLLGTHLLIDRHSVSFDEQQPFWIDVDLFRTTLSALPSSSTNAQMKTTLLNPAQLEHALSLYGHEFLGDFYVDDAPAFEEWVFLQREELRDLALRGFTYLTEYYLTQNDFATGLATTQRWLAIEPWSETAHYQRMILFVRSGQRIEALAQYESCSTMLAEEFGIQPPAAMTALYEQIKAHPSDWQGVEAVTPQALPTLISDTVLTPARKNDIATTLPTLPLAVDSSQLSKSVEQDSSPPQPPLQTPSTTKIFWGEMPRPSFFAGRQTELNQLQRWLFEERCCLVTILGVGGTGKTALAATLVRRLAQPWVAGDKQGSNELAAENGYQQAQSPHTLAQPFTRILWRSLLNAPPLESILRLWLQELSDHQLTSLPTDLDEQLSLLFRYLTQQRCLLVLDNLESILNAEGAAGHYRPDYVDYGVLIQRLGEVEHQSCLLLTSRELPLDVARLERSYPVVRSLRLDGLPTTVGIELLRASGLRAELASMQAVVQRYSGNPLALRLVAETVVDYYHGDVADFLTHETLLFEDIRIVLDQQFRRLSKLEQEIIFWLAVERSPITSGQLALNFVQPPTHRALLEAIRSLHRRSLVERDSLDTRDSTYGEAAFSLQNVVLEYSTERLRDLIYAELVSEKLDHSLRHALVKAQATDYVRNAQSRLILQPIAQRLLEEYSQQAVAGKLRTLVDKLRTTFAAHSGYAAANLLHLAFQMGIKPEGWDFSKLAIWQADLRKEHLPYTNFRGAHFAHSAFMEKFDAILAVAVSQDGDVLAATGASGNVHLWRVSDGELLSICRGRGRWVWSLAFSPHHDLLASGGSDAVVHLWEVATVSQYETAASEVSPMHHALAGHTDTIFGLAFRPDGQVLASASADHTVRLWDVVHKELIQVLSGHTATVYAVAFSPDGQLLASASRDHTVRLWDATTGACCQILESHQTQLVACYFSADGQWLITASVDRLVLIWQVASSESRLLPQARLHHTFTNDAAELSTLALSPDGTTIATNGPDATIRLWSCADGSILKTFSGHTENVQTLAFHPNGKTLVSGSWDQSVRFWDVTTGYLLRTWQGYTNAIQALTLSPDGQTLVSANADGTLCCWPWTTRTLGRPQVAHRGAVQSVAFQPDGQLLVSGGSDCLLRFWQVVDGELREQKTLYGHRGAILHIAFSPAGHLMASSSIDKTIRLWDTHTGDCRQVLQGFTRMINVLAFSPDGKFLVSGSDDGQIDRWPILDGNDSFQDNLVTTYSPQPFATITGGCSSLTFSPDGTLLSSASTDHTIVLWRVSDGKKLLTFETPMNSTVYAVAFRPNQAAHTPQLASSSGTGAICLWNIDLAGAHHQLTYVRNDHKGSVRSICFTADGKTLLSGGADETVRLWEVESGSCVATLSLQQPYVGMKLTEATGLTAAQRAACKALGALE